MKMKTILSIAAPLVLATVASAQVFTFTANQRIPDGDINGVTLYGVVSGVNVSPGYSVSDVNAYINLVADPAAFNGDYYAYLVGPTGARAVLLNRAGRTSGNSVGYSDSGFIGTPYGLVFDDQAINGNIHLYQNVVNPNGGALTGIWAPDGRDVNPLTVTDANTPNKLLSQFNGKDPNGVWYLFVADVGSGQGLGKVTTWGLIITAVPEPQQYAFAAGLALLAFAGYRRWSIKAA